MKRLIYISRVTNDVTNSDLQKIGEISQRNNRQLAITGVLLYLKGLFFQILEGDEQNIDNLYKKILADKRHKDIICLQAEINVPFRLFPDWSMQLINLEENNEFLIQPLKSLLNALSNSHHILEKYTQPAVIASLSRGYNPLLLPARNSYKFVMFTDIFGFSTFSELLPIDKVVKLTNEYFDLCSQIIAERGGNILKYIGDSVMASFEQHQADAAIQAAVDILTVLNITREQSTPDHPGRLLYTGIGLAYGNVIEANMGSKIKMDYTLVGDTVNIAARMESLTRSLDYNLVLTEAVTQQAKCDWSFVALGEHTVKGRQENVQIYSIANEYCHKTAEMRYQVANLAKLLKQPVSTKRYKRN